MNHDHDWLMNHDHDWLERTAGMSLEELWEAFFAANPMIYAADDERDTEQA